MSADYKKADSWSVMAKKEGYPARSVYKLEELIKKFRILTSIPAQAVKNSPLKALDLGASPGSWSLYLLKNLSKAPLKHGAHLVSCDLSPPSNLLTSAPAGEKCGFTFLQGDLLSDEIVQKIREIGPYALIVCDAAPATSGSRFLDSSRQMELAKTALKYAKENLILGGNFVVKVFQGEETHDFIKEAKTIFNQVKTFKPAACRPNSMETYITGLGRLKSN
ncbi:MAG: RlmE family RNA methyltransferase [Spirochaetaceae bacterium]|jgi:23S rRNA (uridine2552-2'-O)-methyltransferase|nr:RlmE family RNA methyltransferase [Spirochaetaceae bacterium]